MCQYQVSNDYVWVAGSATTTWQLGRVKKATARSETSITYDIILFIGIQVIWVQMK